MESRYVEVARAETERGEVVLRERREEDHPSILELRVNGVFVMDSAEVSTEVALAEHALTLVEDPRDVVVGGLGLGYTARAVLADPRVERVAVVEIEEALVGWMRDGTVPQGQTLLADARVKVVVADLAQAVAEARPASYDLVLLDVDNGPDNLVHQANRALYDVPFLEQVRTMLRPGGVVVVWSAAESPELAVALAEVFGRQESHPLAVDLQGRAETYWLHVGRT